jgi:hypothetical protein
MDRSAKSEGRAPFRDLAPYSPIDRRPGSVSRSQLSAISESFGSCERSPRFPSRIRYHIRAARAFLGSIRWLPVSRLPTRVSFPILFSGSFPGPLASSASSSLEVLSPVPLRVPLPVPRSSFPGSLASAASGSPEVPFPALLRVSLPVLRWLLSALF